MTDRLELRYRRLITVYPAGHRAVYAEDMVNALMESALPGQQRPHLGTSIDLLKGAAATWFRRGVSVGRTWQRTDAPAAVTLLALLALCTLSFTAAGMVLDDQVNSSYGRWGELAMWSSDLVWLPVTAVAVLGWRRLAAGLAWGGGILLPAISSLVMIGGWTPGYLGSMNSTPWFVVSVVAAAGLSSDRGLRPGFQVLGGRGTGAAALGVAAIGAAVLPTPAVADAVGPWRDRLGLALLAGGLLLIVLAGGRAAFRNGRTRVLVGTAAIIVLLLVSGLYAWTDGGTWYADLTEQIDLLLPLTVLACGLAVARSTALADQAPPAGAPVVLGR